MRGLKRLLATILAVAVIFTNVNVELLAAEPKVSVEEIQETSNEKKVEAKVAVTSSTGDFSYEELNGSYITITGYAGTDTEVTIPEQIGEFTVQRIEDEAFRDSAVTYVKIPDSVESIGNSAFSDCTELTEIEIGSGLETIEGWAFSGCAALKTITLPENVLTIGSGAFYGCSSITEIKLPNSVTEIGSSAFAECSALTSINYPMSLESAGNGIFENAVNLHKMEVPEGVTTLAEGAFKNCTYLTEIILPDTLEVIGGSSLEGCDGLTSISLPEGLKEIGNWGMYNCPNLTELTLPEGMTTLGKYALSNCTSLTELTLPDSITTMGEGALSDCTNLESVNYPKSLTETGQMIYEGCTKLKTITVPEGVTELPDAAFKNCTNFSEIILPSTLEVIHGAGLEGCSGLKSITLPEGLKEIGNWAMYNNPGLVSLHIPDSVETIGEYALAECENLKTVNYPLSLQTTGRYIFNGNTKLTRITVPEGVTEIPECAFYGCTSLEKITLPDSLVTIYDAGFDTCTGIERMVLPDNVESIGAYAFSACYGLTDIWIGEKVTSIHENSFNVCDTAKLTIHGVEGSYAQTWAEEHGYTFSTEAIGMQDLVIQGNAKDQDGNGIQDVNITVYDCKNLKVQAEIVTDETGAWIFEEAEAGVRYRIRYSHGDYDFSESMQEVTAAAENELLNVTGTITFTGEEAPAEDFTYTALNGSEIKLTGYTGNAEILAIPAEIDGYVVKELGDNLFKNNTVLKEVKIPSGVTTINGNAFYNCSSLESVRFAGQTKTLGGYCFQNCTALKKVALPSGLLCLKNGVFYNCVSLESIELSDSVNEIGTYAFEKCTGLTEINYPMSLESAGNAMFQNAVNLKRIEVPEGVKKLADSAFKNCTSLTEILLPETLEVIGGSSLEGCTGLTSITLPKGLKEIGNWGMYNCPNLTELTLPEGMTTLGQYALSRCTALTELTLPDSITTMGEGALSDCTNLERVNYPKNLTETGQIIYKGCTKLKTITVPEGVTELPDAAFKNCSNFSEIILPETLEVIHGAGLEGCSGLTSITLPEGLKEIGQWGMYNCSGLVSLHIPDSVETIGQYALANCVNLKTVNYPLSLQTTGRYIFERSTKLTRITVPEGVTEIPECAFYGCTSLVKITLPDSLVTIHDAGFDTCTGIERMVLPDNVESIGAYAFSACYGLTDIWIGEKVTSIRDNSFNVCDTEKLTIHGVEGSYAQEWAEEHGYAFSTEAIGMQDLVIRGNVKDQDGNGIQDVNITIYDCKNLKIQAQLVTDETGAWNFEEAEAGVRYRIRYSHGDYDFSESMQEVTAAADNEPLTVTGTITFTGEEATAEDFAYDVINGSEIELTEYTGNAEVLVIPGEIDGYIVKEIGENLFRNNTVLKEVKIPSGVTTINGNAFYNCSSLEKVRFAGNTTTLGGYCFENCTALKEVALPSGLLSLKNGVFYNCVSLKSIDLPDSVNEIGSYAFEKCTGLTEINYPMSLERVGNAMFQNAVNLKSIEVPEGVAYLADSAFKNCTYLTEIILPETLEVIGGSSLEGCSGLKNISLPAGLKEIGNWGMYNCPNLTELNIPESMTTLGKYALSRCTAFTELTLPDSITAMGEGALSDCTNLERVNYPKNLQETGQMIYEGCTKLTSITVPEGVTELPDSAFKNCSNFTEIILPTTLEVIHGAGLEGCSGLTDITLPEGLKEIGNWGMYNNTGLVSLHIPDSVERIGRFALAQCVNLEEIHYPKALNETGDSIFSGDKKLRTISIPEGVTSIPVNAFKNATYLRYLELPSTLKEIQDAAFEGCIGLPNLTLNEGLESIGNYSFYGCEGLLSVTISETVTTIGESAFRNCENVLSIYLPDNITSIGENAFAECEKLRLYCMAHSNTLSYAIDNGLTVAVADANTVERKVLSDSETYYSTNSGNVTSSGYLDLILKYKVKEEKQDNISQMSVRVGLPEDYTLIENSITVNGRDCSDFTAKTGMFDVPVTEKEGVIRFSVNPTNDRIFCTAAQLLYTEDGEQKRDFIGCIYSDVPTISLLTNDTTNTNKIKVSGVAPAQSLIKFYIDDVSVGEVNASKAGYYNTQITIPDAVEGTTYKVKAVTTVDGQTIAKTVNVKYSAAVPVVEELKLYYSGHDSSMRYYNRVIDLMSTREIQNVITFNPNYSYTFSVKMSHPELVDHVYVTSTRNGEKKAIRAEWDEKTQQFVTSEKFDGTNTQYVPGYISVEYQLKNGEYDFDEEIDETYDEFFENVPEHVKNADVGEVKETTDGDVTRKETTLTLANEEKTKLLVVEERRKASYTETELLNSGYKKVVDASGDVKYIKLKIDDESIEEIIFDKGKDELITYSIDALDVGEFAGGMYSIAGILTDGGESLMEIASLRMQIEMSNMSPAEKKIAMDKLQTVIDYHASKLVISYVFFAAGIVAGLTFPASLVLVGAELVVQQVMKDYYNSVLEGNGASFNLFKSLFKNTIGAFLKWIIDPSGYVYEAVTDNRLENVTATVFYQDENGTAIEWDALEYDQINPIITLNDGIYAWDVPEGLWQVKYEKEGYETVTSDWLEVPPPQTDVNVGLVSYEVPEVAQVDVKEGSVQLQFSKYMIPETVSGITLTDVNGNPIAYTLEYSQDEKSGDGTVYADSYTMKFDEYQLENGEECIINIPKSVKSYAGTGIKATSLTETYKGMAELSAEDTVELHCGARKTIRVNLITERDDLAIAAESMFEQLVQVVSVNETGDGNWSVVLEGSMSGTTAVAITVPGTTLKKYVTVTVGKAENDSEHTHIYGEPVFEWDGFETCTASRMCECGDYISEACTVSEEVVKATYTEDGEHIYTAKVIIDGVDYSDSRSQIIAKVNTPKLSYTKVVYDGSAKKPTATVTDADGNKLVNGTDYTVTYASGRKNVGRYAVTVTLKGNYSGSKKVYFTIVPKKTGSLTAQRYQYGNQIRLSWTKVTGATGYRIEYKKPGATKYTFLTNTKNLYYTKGSLTANKTYYFKVTPYVEINGTKYYSTATSAYRTTSIATVAKGGKLAQVSKPTITRSGTKVKVKWKNVANETGYEISQSTSKTGTKIISTYKTTSGTSKLVAATKGKTYYYKVRAYRTVNGKKIYGAWSTVVKYKR